MAMRFILFPLCPTFHPQLIEILRKLRTIANKISIVTTSDGLTENNYRSCMDNVDILRLSVSSIDKKTFHQIHRGLDYDKIWENIDKLVKYNPEKLNIHLVGGEITYPTLEETIKFFKQNGVDNIHLFPLWNRGGNIQEQNINEMRSYLVNKYNISYSEDEYLDEDISSVPMRDILNRLERYQLINSAEEWVYIRELRNEIAHDYPLFENDIVNILNELISKISVLKDIYGRLKKVYLDS